ncbi:hypothetical protein TGPRC2_309195 [Toxoplasma gondii TgCatPRC2]|uniref:Uncharacterized protein n=6 Tax=Toxoplasma gondii TaxID=5811 RepID=A0A125YNZ1_TOXGV|nr:hypothetical protein TGME49_309195 [Toxoplasma gondii ME49]ESS34757.1 hypothetical protein TGVEG_309195 [Toxoplasma gondii VEG]KFG40581.1 hypothetical protein TGP89_309195 [Toxoplasma gondii p89]KFH10118.1 hypothetical protein TGVAND_309195 [Toxoplasma gondii VAND]KYF47428.1 hypothetical protein TGARI_309195 [Toxoplasma gondii ARI]KYK70164.1 hypothetical protein TGPRC2_309195 [Toxoplasma gondii TgCatPRC2]|eukprot:XP_018635625.1 hypothetical protein TGME49_309195 [Toxoplasma gondii ME49]
MTFPPSPRSCSRPRCVEAFQNAYGCCATPDLDSGAAAAGVELAVHSCALDHIRIFPSLQRNIVFRTFVAGNSNLSNETWHKCVADTPRLVFALTTERFRQKCTPRTRKKTPDTVEKRKGGQEEQGPAACAGGWRRECLPAWVPATLRFFSLLHEEEAATGISSSFSNDARLTEKTAA